MKMYSLYNLLMFFKLQHEQKYAVIENIISIIDSDKYTDEQMRELIFELLRESGMTEEGFESDNDVVPTEPEMIESAFQTQEFEVKIQDRIYHIVYYLN